MIQPRISAHFQWSFFLVILPGFDFPFSESADVMLMIYEPIVSKFLTNNFSTKNPCQMLFFWETSSMAVTTDTTCILYTVADRMSDYTSLTSKIINRTYWWKPPLSQCTPTQQLYKEIIRPQITSFAWRHNTMLTRNVPRYYRRIDRCDYQWSMLNSPIGGFWLVPGGCFPIVSQPLLLSWPQ